VVDGAAQIAGSTPSCEIHPLSIGGREDPVRLLGAIARKPATHLLTCSCDAGAGGAVICWLSRGSPQSAAEYEGIIADCIPGAYARMATG
jgi:hypothetical protein